MNQQNKLGSLQIFSLCSTFGRYVGLVLVLLLLISWIGTAGAGETYTSWVPPGDKNIMGVYSSRVFINHIKINKPPQVVLDFASNLELLPKWYPDAAACYVLKGTKGTPMKPGDITLEAIKQRITPDDPTAGIEYTCTARLDPKLWRIEGRRYKGGKVVSNVLVAATYLTYPEPDGNTTFVRIWELFDEYAYSYAVFKMDKEQLHEHFQKGLVELKAAVETLP